MFFEPTCFPFFLTFFICFWPKNRETWKTADKAYFNYCLPQEDRKMASKKRNKRFQPLSNRPQLLDSKKGKGALNEINSTPFSCLSSVIELTNIKEGKTAHFESKKSLFFIHLVPIIFRRIKKLNRTAIEFKFSM